MIIIQQQIPADESYEIKDIFLFIRYIKSENLKEGHLEVLSLKSHLRRENIAKSVTEYMKKYCISSNKIRWG